MLQQKKLLNCAAHSLRDFYCRLDTRAALLTHQVTDRAFAQAGLLGQPALGLPHFLELCADDIGKALFHRLDLLFPLVTSPNVGKSKEGFQPLAVPDRTTP